MAKPSKPQVSSDEALSNSEEEEQINEQIGEEEDEEEIEAVARSAGSDDDDAAAGNSPASDDDAAADENGDGDEDEVKSPFFPISEGSKCSVVFSCPIQGMVSSGKGLRVFYGGLGCFWFVLGEEGEEEVSGMYFR